MEARADNTIVVIPSYNEARTIGSIVRDIVKMGFNVLVIDDGSTDNTKGEALDNGAMVIRNKDNLGKGLSIREGIKHIFDKLNYEWMIIMDGDGQHHPEDIPILIRATQVDNSADIVVGNRMRYTSSMPAVRYLTNRFMSWVISKMCRQYIPDSQCGYRLLRINSLRNMRLTTDRYDIESEVLIEAARNKCKIISVPIRTIYGNEVSEIHPIRDTIKFFHLIFKYFFQDSRR